MKKELVDMVRVDYPDFRFRRGKRFAFRPPDTILIGPEEEYDSLLFMHEGGHAVSGHRDFNQDAKRIKMEREAWERARDLCLKYGVNYDEDVVECELDTYREWLDQKSRCPVCGLTRFQTPDGQYHCPRCDNFKLKQPS